MNSRHDEPKTVIISVMPASELTLDPVPSSSYIDLRHLLSYFPGFKPSLPPLSMPCDFWPRLLSQPFSLQTGQLIASQGEHYLHSSAWSVRSTSNLVSCPYIIFQQGHIFSISKRYTHRGRYSDITTKSKVRLTHSTSLKRKTKKRIGLSRVKGDSSHVGPSGPPKQRTNTSSKPCPEDSDPSSSCPVTATRFPSLD